MVPAVVYAEQTTGVKKGDWMDYEVVVTGTESMPPSHEICGTLMEVLSVDGVAFSVNVTARYINGTSGSAVWKFNFTEGNVEGWTIIPANLGVGDTFFDYYPKPTDVAIEREEQKMVLGASRTVTCGSDVIRQIKEWDKATGFFIYSVEVIQNRTIDGWYIDSLTITTRAVATNIWDKQIFGLEQTIFALAISGLVFIVVTLISALIIWQKNKLPNRSLRYSLQTKRAIAISVIIGAVVFTATVIPTIWMNMGLRNAEVNMITQSLWLGLILVSMSFRKTGKHFVHGILMVAVIIATLIGFTSVIMMWSPSDSSSMGVYFSSSLKVAEFVAHGVLYLFPKLFPLLFWRVSCFISPFE